MNISQQQQENKDSWRSTGDYTSDHLDLLDSLTTSTWHNAQEEMLERVRAIVAGFIEENCGEPDMYREAKTMLDEISSLRAGETPYYKRDHFHCWEQKVAACGLTKHTQCCLCEEPIAGESTKPPIECCVCENHMLCGNLRYCAEHANRPIGS